MANVRTDIEAVVYKRGFTFVKDLVRNERHRLFVVKQGREKLVIKATAVPSEMVNLRNEALAHQFLQPLAPPKATFAFPQTEIWEDGDVFVSASPFVQGTWLAEKENHGRLTQPLTEKDLEDLFQTMLFLHRIPPSDVPVYFMKRAKKEFTLEKMLEKQCDYLTPAIGKILSKKEAERLQALTRDAEHAQRFVHHDMQLPNIVRQRNKKLLITDAEFARWGVKWYDVAYFFLQAELLYNQPVLAKRALRFFVRRFSEELPGEDLRHEIFFPLSYRLSANISIALNEPKSHKRVHRMLELILEQDLDGMMGR